LFFGQQLQSVLKRQKLWPIYNIRNFPPLFKQLNFNVVKVWQQKWEPITILIKCDWRNQMYWSLEQTEIKLVLSFTEQQFAFLDQRAHTFGHTTPSCEFSQLKKSSKQQSFVYVWLKRFWANLIGTNPFYSGTNTLFKSANQLVVHRLVISVPK
jgi:hypothetical protein